MSETTFTFRVDEALKNEFATVCARDDRCQASPFISPPWVPGRC